MPANGPALSCGVINYQIAPNENEFTLNILLLQSTVIRNVNCTHAHSVSLSAWLGDTLILQ